MNRTAGIIVAAVGLVLAVLGALKVVHGTTSAGVALILLGGLIIGLSFVDKPDPEDVPRMSTGASLINIFVSPGEVFQNLRRHPRWLVAVLVMTIASSIFANLFVYRLGAERIANFAIDKTLEMSMIQNNEDAKKNVEASRPQAIADAKDPVVRAGQAVNGFVGATFWYAFLGLVFFLFAMAMGGKMNFWQGFAAAVYASFPVAIIRWLLSGIVLFIKDPTEIHPITGQASLIQDNLNFLVTAADHPVLYTLLGSLSLLWFYWIWMNATGIKNAGERVSSSTGWTAAITVYIVLVILMAGLALLFPSFIS